MVGKRKLDTVLVFSKASRVVIGSLRDALNLWLTSVSKKTSPTYKKSLMNSTPLKLLLMR